MEKKLRKTGNSLIDFILILLCMNTAVYAQNFDVILSSDKTELTENQRITFTVTTNVQSSIVIEFPKEFEVDYGVMHGMEQKMDQHGKIRSVYYMQQSGIFKRSGNYTIYAKATHKNKTVKSNTVSIKVNETSDEEFTKIKTNEPIFGILQSSKTSVYEGEPLLVKAKVFSAISVEYLEGYVPFKSDISMETHSFPNNRVEVEQTSINGKDALTFEYGKQVLIPVSTGKCRIHPFEMALRCSGSVFSKTYKIKSSGLNVQVKPLPNGAPKDFIGAVGSYQLIQGKTPSELKAGEVFTLEITIKGAGNLHNINTPKIQLPAGCFIYGDPEKEEAFQFTELGATGKITFKYNIQLNTDEDLVIKAPSFSYFDPSDVKYVTISGKDIHIKVTGSVPKSNQLAQVQPVKTDKLTAASKEAGTSNPSSNILVWSIAIPAAALSLLFLVLFLRKKKDHQSLINEIKQTDKASQPCDEEKTVVSEVDYWKQAKQVKDNPEQFAVVFPKALIQFIEQCKQCKCESREKAFVYFEERAPEQATRFKEMISECDQFRYGFGEQTLNPDLLIEEAEKIMQQLKK